VTTAGPASGEHGGTPESAPDLFVRPSAELTGLRSRGLLLLVVGLAAMGVGYAVNGPESVLQSYLIAYLFWIGVTVGSLALLMVQYLSGGAWGLVGRRVFEASTRNLPIMALLFIPIAIGLPTLYEWARPEAAADHILHEKAAYLNVPFFYVRAALYFVIWGVLAYLLNRWSHEQDQSAPRLPGPKDGRLRVLSGPGLVLYVLTITFMSVDWIMSLEPHFTSTIFGILTLGGQGLSTLAFTILMLAWFGRARPLSSVIQPSHFHDFGKLMLAFVMLWAYFNVSQLIIIWSANLPEEIPWYLERLQGIWGPVAVVVLIGHFALPFSLLLSRDLKRKASTLSKVAIWVIVMRVVDLSWTIGPTFHGHSGPEMLWQHAGAVVAMGGIWLVFFARALAGRALVPAHDPYFKDAVAHGAH
jgi:hypothetical protein